MKTMIIDDEAHAREYLKHLLEEHFSWVRIVGEAGTLQESLDLISKAEPDLLLLDIRLGDESGFDLLSVLGKSRCQVIFVTAHDEYAIRAIRFAAIDYLLKPVVLEDLRASLERAKERFRPEAALPLIDGLADLVKETRKSKQTISILHRNAYLRVPITQIQYCFAINHCVEIYRDNLEKLVTTRPLIELQEILEPFDFFRCHQSYLVNKDFVSSMMKDGNNARLVMKNGKILPVARLNTARVRALLHN